MMKLLRTCASLLLLAGVLIGTRSDPGAQSLTYNRGQNVAPAYEGWEAGADGVKYFVFGYMNRNWEEELDVPVGPDNGFSPGNPDQGQPTHFLPRRNRFVFKVPVPASFGDTDELVWTLTTHGKTEKAYASLRLDYQIDDVVKASETGALGAGTSSPEVRANKPPVVTLEGPKARTVKVGQPLTLVMTVTDDGVPKSRLAQQLAALQSVSPPSEGSASGSGSSAGTAAGGTAAPGSTGSGGAAAAGSEGRGSGGAAGQGRRNPFLSPPVRVTVGKNVGLHLSWFVYRGAGKVTFTPDQIKVWEDTRAGANSPWAPIWIPPALPKDGRITTEAVFSEPGTYVLRGLADDGALLAHEDVTVTVTP